MSVDFSIAWKTGAKILNEIISLLPNIILGMLILILFLIVASLPGLSRAASRCGGSPIKVWRSCWQGSFTPASRRSVS